MDSKQKEELRQKQIKSGYDHIDNLVSWNDRTKEEIKEIKQKGQKASVEVRKAKKNIKQICNELLSINASDIAHGIISPQLEDKLKDTDITLYDLIVAKQIEVALKSGDVKSAVFLRDSVGDKPSEKVETDVNVITDVDRQLLQSLSDRIDSLEAVDTTTTDNV